MGSHDSLTYHLLCSILITYTSYFLKLEFYFFFFFSKENRFLFVPEDLVFEATRNHSALRFQMNISDDHLWKWMLKFITRNSLLITYIMKYINYPEKYIGRLVYPDYRIIICVYFLLHSPFLTRILSKFAFSKNVALNLCFLMELLMDVENQHFKSHYLLKKLSLGYLEKLWYHQWFIITLLFS